VLRLGFEAVVNPCGVMRPVPKGPEDGLQPPIGRSTMSEQTTKALPIVLIHGLWMTARSWDRWAQYYRAKGHEVVVPSYPGFVG
jgi:pimeloyl-ACP methyl ester carboxylesterase